MSTDIENLFKDKVLGHPAGLFVLFFTEMWERFSFYGMRVLLINFLTMALVGYNPGWEWTVENAGALFGTYAMLLYITPIIGGIIADKITGYRWAVIIGAAIMTLGHVSMAFETEFSLYLGLALLVIGTGFFKPTMTSIISEMYKENPEKKDGAYTIYYMGVNAGAFFGMMLCGYLAEKVGWAYGFGLAGVFMLLGTLQFWLAGSLFGSIGAKPSKVHVVEVPQNINEEYPEKRTDGGAEEPLNPFTTLDKILIIISSVIGLGYAFNDPLSKIGGIDMFSALETTIKGVKLEGQYIAVLFALALFLFLVISRISRYTKVVRDRMVAFIIFAFFTVFFWLSFEQGASSLVIFARDNVDRLLSGTEATIFNIVNTLLTVVPLVIITYVLYVLWKKTYSKIPGSNVVLVICFLGMWTVVGWMLNRDFNTTAYDVIFQAIETPVLDEQGMHKKNEDGVLQYSYTAITTQTQLNNTDKVVERTTSIAEPIALKVGDKVHIITKNNEGTEFGYLDAERLQYAKDNAKKLNRDNGIVNATVSEIKENEVEITVSWFSILNSFFIIAFASMFSRWWDSKYNPSAATKYALGLIIMAIGFGLLAYGSYGMKEGVKVSMIWLVLAYLFHTLGELCLSPVGLSYVSKLVPARMIAFMFGMWYLAIAIGNKLAAVLGGQIENITKQYDLSTFFLIFTIVPLVAGVLVFLLNPVIKKLMHGVK
ncbi:peptide MFS transporter [Tenacibaculum maritimum]|uniref:peptide MFS transporter n=1 Tax=Tenacibaculum maritimum TaxID=107401 RepID=UPI0010A53549|nr:peptide MFS transporter [Tenacibaculum maritimum]QCD62993.1 MFS transporter [Tenacibaculum maritimum]CAA0143146.1 Di-tripeptide transporter family protein, ABC transporter-like permease [Tenacibaculum maritimum]CAA0146588.1 Di-tripeptide transporter family protein, ABC transporter-like permease [Tenacibaculum maritimum]CAA0146718.1 Di-tripeptide transporter family protein, ABC transporter-like permease [Tenacibaculum maritimum]CAA0146791.1 Di-tripeptide transporter family protein, ABC trans